MHRSPGTTGARRYRRSETRRFGQTSRGRQQPSQREAYSTYSRDHGSRHKCSIGTATPYQAGFFGQPRFDAMIVTRSPSWK